jgi:hypothetical protein
MFPDEGIHHCIDRFSCGKTHFEKGHTGNTEVVAGFARRPGDRDGKVDGVVFDQEVQGSLGSLDAQKVAHQTGAAATEITNHQITLRIIDLELCRVADGDPSMEPDLQIVLFEQNIRKHEADRFVRGIVPEVPANAMMNQGGNDRFGGTRSDRNKPRGRYTKAFRDVGNVFEFDTRREEYGVDSSLRFAREHLGFVDVICVMNVEISPDQVQGETLQFAIGRIEYQYTAFDFHWDCIGLLEANPKWCGR